MISGLEAFKDTFGSPETPGEEAMKFNDAWSQQLWSFAHDQTGVGDFLGGFVHLFTERVEALHPVLEAWEFLLPDDVPRRVIGRNAYGALLLLERPVEDGTKAKIGLLDPIGVQYFTDPNLNFVSLISRWLPQGLLPHFNENEPYRVWQEKTGLHLAMQEVLGIKIPLVLEGSWSVDNFQVEDISEYYQTTGDIYRKRFAK